MDTRPRGVEVTVNPGQERTIEFVMAVGNGDDETVSQAGKWAADFEPTFAAAKTQWEKRYADCFCARETTSTPATCPCSPRPTQAMRRVYYMGIVSRLQMLRTNLPVQPRIMVTGGPQFAVTVTYFWDNTLLLMSMLDPGNDEAAVEALAYSGHLPNGTRRTA